MKKYIIPLIILAIATGFYFYRGRIKTDVKTVVPTIEQQLSLPSEWTKVVESKVELKLEKRVDSGLKPQIAYIKTVSKDALAPSKYVDRIKAGARSAVPSLTFLTDKRDSSENNYSALISGYYYNQKNKISLIQRVIVKGDVVNVLTASYSGDMDSEINSILDSIVKEKI